MRTTLFCVAILLLAAGANSDTPRQRAQALLNTLNQQEKITLVHGAGGGYVGNVPAISSAKIPKLNLEDGPQGVADGVSQVTCFPASLTIGATWDLALANQWAQAMGKEQRIKGTNVMLGPDVNLCRTPVGGRNFEMFGEDPYLTAAYAGPVVKGIQSQGVIACAKHWVNNDQEYQRNSVSVNVDERTNFEVYYQPFQAAVDAGVGSFMCSYNRINNTYACENPQTVKVDLKERLGFQGWLMSDWGATHSTVNSANNGLDQEMPGGGFFGDPLNAAVNSGSVPKARLDDMCLRILTSMFAGGLFDNAQTGDLNQNAQSAAHQDLARKLSAAGTVLLRNDAGLLPLVQGKYKKIGIIGADGNTQPMPTGGGSGGVKCPYVITPLNGIKNASSQSVVTYNDGSNSATVGAFAKGVDLAIVFGHSWSSEGGDRGNFQLSGGEDAMVEAVLAANPNTIVVIHAVGAVLMPWEKSAKTILHAFVPGQEMGHAIADVLYGKVNPSGRLPITLPAAANEIPTNTQRQYPGMNGQIYYDEKLNVGHRWYDANKVTPLFPFGHGLSYTTFTYSNLKISGSVASGVQVTVDIANTGKVSGSEVAQLYLVFPAFAGEPPQILAGFDKVTINEGASSTASFTLTERQFSIWSVQQKGWTQVKGEFGILVGSSSRDIHQKGSFTN